MSVSISLLNFMYCTGLWADEKWRWLKVGRHSITQQEGYVKVVVVRPRGYSMWSGLLQVWVEQLVVRRQSGFCSVKLVYILLLMLLLNLYQRWSSCDLCWDIFDSCVASERHWAITVHKCPKLTECSSIGAWASERLNVGEMICQYQLG